MHEHILDNCCLGYCFRYGDAAARNKEKIYIIIMAIIHAFVCGFRYQYLTGDLQTYHNVYVTLPQYGG